MQKEGGWHIGSMAIMGVLIGCIIGLALRGIFDMGLPSWWPFQ